MVKTYSLYKIQYLSKFIYHFRILTTLQNDTPLGYHLKGGLRFPKYVLGAENA